MGERRCGFPHAPGVTSGNTITVDGTQAFRGLQFVDDGYTLTGAYGALSATGNAEIRILGGTATIETEITGTGSLWKTQGGTLVLLNQNTYKGGTYVAGGTLQVSADANLGSIDNLANGITLNGGTLRIEGTNYTRTARLVTIGENGGTIHNDNGFTLRSYVGGTGDLYKRGYGQLRFDAGAGYRNLFVEEGSVIGTSTTIRGNVSLAANTVVRMDDAVDFSTDRTFSGSGNLYFGRSANRVLTGNSDGFTGRVNLEGGSLLLDGGEIGGSVLAYGGTTLGGTGTIGSGNSTVQVFGNLNPGYGTGGLYIRGNLVLGAGSNVNFDLGEASASQGLGGINDRLSVAGDLTLAGTLNLLQSSRSSDGVAGFGYYRLMDYSGTLRNNGITIGTKPVIAGADVYELLMGSGYVDLFIGSMGDRTLQHWQGGDGLWNASNKQWLNADGALADNWNGEVAIFRNLPGQFSGGVVTVEGAQAFTGIQFGDEGYRLTGTGSLVTDAEGFEIRVLANSARIDTAISGTGALNKTQGGTLYLAGDNTYEGGTSVQGGLVSVSRDANLGKAGTGISLNGGGLQFTGTAFGTLTRDVLLGENGGTIDIADADHTLTVSSSLTGTGALYKRGAGTLSLTRTNAYAGTIIEAGRVNGSRASLGGNVALGVRTRF
ncbi:autotransporter-associated beta strand repeat-containing protein [Brevundimonas sp. GN22]